MYGNRTRLRRGALSLSCCYFCYYYYHHTVITIAIIIDIILYRYLESMVSFLSATLLYIYNYYVISIYCRRVVIIIVADAVIVVHGILTRDSFDVRRAELAAIAKHGPIVLNARGTESKSSIAPRVIYLPIRAVRRMPFYFYYRHCCQ